MNRVSTRWFAWIAPAMVVATLAGCSSFRTWSPTTPWGNSCNACDADECGDCDECDDGGFGWRRCCGCCTHRSLAIPDTYPLGSVNRAHYHAMQTNAEAADFIIHRHEFVDFSAELSPYGKDHIVEIAARARSAPFPVIIERSENNSDPELDEFRRYIVAQVLADFGVPEADQRTIVAPAYGRGLNSREAEFDYYNFTFTRGFNSFGGSFGQFGGFGGIGGGLGFGP